MILLIIISLSTLSILYFSFIILCNVGWYKTKNSFVIAEKNVSTTVSIIVVARNEEQNISKCIHAALQQTYPADLLQLIVVDDNSTDNTFELANSLKRIYPNLLVVKSNYTQENIVSFKKQAITQAIDLANGELIITHDADCIAGERWIATVVDFYITTKAAAIAMPIKFEKGKGILHQFQEQDLAGMMAITAGSIYFNIPLMANAANMAFQKNAFQKVNGFDGNEKVPGGDDIFLLLKIKKAFSNNSIFFLKHTNVIVTTSACSSFNDFFQQRMRWLSKSSNIGSNSIKGILIASYLFNLMLFFAAVYSLIIKSSLLIMFSLIIYFLKWIVEYYVVRNSSHFLQQPFSITNYLLSNMLHHVYVIAFGAFSLFAKYRWKGRKY